MSVNTVTNDPAEIIPPNPETDDVIYKTATDAAQRYHDAKFEQGVAQAEADLAQKAIDDAPGIAYQAQIDAEIAKAEAAEAAEAEPEADGETPAVQPQAAWHKPAA